MRTRRRFSAEFKAKVALEAIKGHRDGRGAGDQARAAPDPDCGVEARGDREAGQGVRREGRRESSGNRDAELTKLHAKIGQLVVERDFLAKAFDR